jgi:diguanylate cyclase
MAFLKTKTLQPTFHKVIFVALIFYLLTLPMIFFTSTHLAAKINIAVTISGVVIVFIAAIRSVLQGYAPARYFLIGQGSILIGVSFTALTSRGIIPFYSLAPEIMKWAAAFELLFFSFALADLVNNERKLREQAQNEFAKAQKELLDSQIQQTEKLDELVRQRTEELEVVNRRLQDLNKTDELTGFFNRRHLNEVLPKEYQRAFREKSNLSIILFDIDHFKQINDKYGHPFGDLCLKKVGELLRDTPHRPSDMAFRYGGEEFVVVLPNTNLEGAMVLAERLRNTISQYVISDDKHSSTITTSMGVASEIPTNREGHGKLLSKADQRLYLAKENGRNQVVACDDI